MHQYSHVKSNIRVVNGDTITGLISGEYKITIAAGATVMLSGVTIDGSRAITPSTVRRRASHAKATPQSFWTARTRSRASMRIVSVAEGQFRAEVYVYFPPKLGKFDGYMSCFDIVWDGEKFERAD